MDLWKLPAIDPSILSSAKDFAERHVWLPLVDHIRTFFVDPPINIIEYLKPMARLRNESSPSPAPLSGKSIFQIVYGLWVIGVN